MGGTKVSLVQKWQIMETGVLGVLSVVHPPRKLWPFSLPVTFM